MSRKSVCFLCDESSDLKNASAFRLGNRIYKCAVEVQDSRLFAKLSVGDLIAQEAKYHPKRVVALHNAGANLKNTSEATNTYQQTQARKHGLSLAYWLYRRLIEFGRLYTSFKIS